jgi:hypothetical protein
MYPGDGYRRGHQDAIGSHSEAPGAGSQQAEIGGEWFETLEFPVPITSRMLVADRPVIAPLAQVLRSYHHHGVVLVDREHVRILSVYLGTAENIARLRSVLPERLLEMVIHTGPSRIAGSASRVIAEIDPFLQRRRQEEQQRIADRLHERVRQDYLATAGLQSILSALQAGRVETLLIAGDDGATGSRCPQCGFIFGLGVRVCRYDGTATEGGVGAGRGAGACGGGERCGGGVRRPIGARQPPGRRRAAAVLTPWSAGLSWHTTASEGLAPRRENNHEIANPPGDLAGSGPRAVVDGPGARRSRPGSGVFSSLSIVCAPTVTSLTSPAPAEPPVRPRSTAPRRGQPIRHRRLHRWESAPAPRSPPRLRHADATALRRYAAHRMLHRCHPWPLRFASP